ncbi:MAG: pantoate--beta-alanine ligase [Phycisphaerae bacterium]|nr:pantoate--beta-alanine ligase [Phycisphaerae bacterium]
METARTIADVRRAVAAARGAGKRIHLVPTMGALHEGHRSLLRAARADGRLVVASIFVNPTQFGPGEDFERYPRPVEADLDICGQDGVDVVFLPSVAEMYPPDGRTTVHVAGLTKRLCGAHRPGHFDGVTTVVLKLFNIVQPDAAYFGQKDGQQVAVIRRMVADLDVPTEIVVCPTVRDTDGVALSSRNAYLEPDQRRRARCLIEALRLGEAMIRDGERRPDTITRAIRARIEATGGCTIDYIEAVDLATLEPAAWIDRPCMLAGAIRIGSTRLIDNVVVDVSDGGG